MNRYFVIIAHILLDKLAQAIKEHHLTNMPEEVLVEGEVQERRDALRRTVQEAFAAEDMSTLRLILNDYHPADLADLFRHLADEG